MSESRTEAILENMLGASHALEPPQSRVEAALTAILNGEEYTGEAKSRVEMLLKEISQQGGGNVDVEALAVDANGTYTAPEGTAYSPVTVDVEPDLMAKSVTENGTYQAASDNVDGYSAVTVDVEANVGTKSITQNGTYTAASEQLDGYSEVTVNVSGGGGQEVPEKDVNFIDYDGTVLYSYTAQEALALTALPANPSHEGLTAQGWNYTLAEVKTEVNAVGGATVGQMYVTDDGKTRIYINIPEDAPSNALMFSLQIKSTMTDNCVISWGDGTSETVGRSTSVLHSHTYAATGDYIITLEVLTGTISFAKGNDSTCSIYGPVANAFLKTRIRAVYIGLGVAISEYTFSQCYMMESVSMPSAVVEFGMYAFNNCYSLKGFVIPRGTIAMGASMFFTCTSLKRVSIPQSATSVAGIQSNVARVNVPSETIMLGVNAFATNAALLRLTVPSKVEDIKGGAFNNSGILEYHFLSTTPPTITTNSFPSNIYSGVKIYVPSASLSTYQSATNWSAQASKIVGE